VIPNETKTPSQMKTHKTLKAPKLKLMALSKHRNWK